MRHLNLIVLLSVAPSLALAQSSVSGKADTRTRADVSAGQTQASAGAEASAEATVTANHPQPKPHHVRDKTRERTRAMQRLSAEGRARAEAAFQQAQRDSVPEHPLVSAMLEAEAKGATEAQILVAQQRAYSRLKTAQEVLVGAGRRHPSKDEVHRGANVLARGVTKAQLKKLVQRCPSDRSLVVAFETVAALTSQGMPTSTAVAEVGAQLEARASDDAIRSLHTTLAVDGSTTAGVGGSAGGVGVGAGTTTSAGATAGGAAGGASAAGGLTGTITGTLTR